MTEHSLKQLIINSLEDMKAENIVTISVDNKTCLFDDMIIASGTSGRHAKAIADKTISALRKQGIKPLSLEGEREAEWILIDYVDVIVHIMKPEIREYYKLEELWSAKQDENQHL